MIDQREPRESEPHVDLKGLVHHTELPNIRMSKFLDTSIGWAGYSALISEAIVGELPG